MALREEILAVLNNSVVEDGAIPNGFAELLQRVNRQYTRREGNVATNAFPVFFGPRERQDKGWLLFWECPEDEAEQLRQNPGLRFDFNQPFVIPLLANERPAIQ